jgi:LytR cell envelope-related transcriptional attenuator
VDHPLPSVGRWRTRALVAATIAALELVVLVAIAAVVLGRSLIGGVEEATRAHALAPIKPKPTVARAEAPMLERSETSVVILNGNGIAGAAADTATRVRGLSYVVASVGNAQRSDYGASVVMHRDDYRREAERLAKELGIKLVGPLDGLRERDLMGAHVAVVIGH